MLTFIASALQEDSSFNNGDFLQAIITLAKAFTIESFPSHIRPESPLIKVGINKSSFFSIYESNYLIYIIIFK